MLWRKINGTQSGECVRWIHNAVYMEHTWSAHGCSVMLTLQPWAVADLAPLCMLISQARILEWVAIFYSRGSSGHRDPTHVSCVSCIDRWIFYNYITWEAIVYIFI